MRRTKQREAELTSAQHLTVNEALIASFKEKGKSAAEIAKMLGREPAHVSGEIKRLGKQSKAFARYYASTTAQKELAALKRAGVKLRSIRRGQELLVQRLSDEEISKALKITLERAENFREQVMSTKTETAKLLKALDE